MRHFLQLTRHELRVLLIAPSTYVAAVLFLCIMGGIYLLGLEDAARAAKTDLPSTLFFQVFWLPVFFIVPMLTMRSIAEERRLGTLEAMMTTPISAGAMVGAKFTAAYLFYLTLWALTLIFPLLASFALGTRGDPRLLDWPSLLGGLTFVAVSGALFVSIGIFASSMTRSTLVSGMLSFSLLFILILSGGILTKLSLIDTASFQCLNEPLEYLKTFRHLEDFSRGIIDSRPFFFYFSNTLLLLGLTALVVESKT